MLDSFLTEMIMRRTNDWFEQRNPLGPSLTGVRPIQLVGGNWFVHLTLSNDRPVMHALVRMSGVSVQGFDIIQADGTICPVCRTTA